VAHDEFVNIEEVNDTDGKLYKKHRICEQKIS